jgi:sugar fermentation stimulation protein A
MKFKNPLTEAVLIKRNFRFLADIMVTNTRKRTIYCPNLGPLLNCDIPGTPIWFSAANRLSQGYLDVLELAEVSDGSIVVVNPHYARLLIRESVQQGIIPELRNYRFLHINVVDNVNNIELLLKENGEQCFIQVEPVFFGDERGNGYFPDPLDHSLAQLQELIVQKEMGNRAVLLYCVMHTGIQCLRTADTVHSYHGKMLRKAIACGVEIMAHRIDITLQDIKLDERIPIVLSENIISR